MQENSKQQYSTNPMDPPPELSQPSYFYMGFKGDADVRLQTTTYYDAFRLSPSHDQNALPSSTPAEWKLAGDLVPFSFNPENSGEWVYYESQVNPPDVNNSALDHNPGFAGDGQDIFMQPPAFHGGPLASNGLDSAPWDFPSRDLNGLVTSAAIDFPSSLDLGNGDAPGFQNHLGQNVCDQPVAQSDAATGSLPLWDFKTSGTSTSVHLSSLDPGNASASDLQSYGSQNVWDQNPSQNNAAASPSWVQSMVDPLFNGAFPPSNVDGGSIDTGVGQPMIWPTNTNMEGDFQRGVRSNIAAPLIRLDDRNKIWPLAIITGSSPQKNLGPNQALYAKLPGPQPPAPALAPALVTTNSTSTIPGFRCTMCTRAFKRRFGCTRHEASVHGINRRLHLCPVLHCPKSHGNGFSRSDKVTKHLWENHANLGYTKAA